MALENLGLAGDGDEIDAVEEVEKTFGVIFDQSDVSNWLTVDDVFASLLRRLDRSDAEGACLWPRFVEAIGHGAALKADEIAQIMPQTRLLTSPRKL